MHINKHLKIFRLSYNLRVVIMFYDKVLLMLYVIVIVIVFLELHELWGIAAIVLLFLVIFLVQKINIEDKLGKYSKKREEILDNIMNRIELFSKNLDELKYNLNKHLFAVETRIDELRHDHEIEIEKNYRELAKKIFEIENRLNGVKKTLGSALGSLDERLRNIEKDSE